MGRKAEVGLNIVVMIAIALALIALIVIVRNVIVKG